nr:ribonuclease H-like domain-containing protein [Tanacetum cinerariifolium]
MQKRKNDVKARTTLLLALPDEHQLRFSKHKTAQELWAAILKTFGGNEATKKTKKNLLKQQYGNFKAEGSETLEQTFNRLQKKSESNSQNMAFISSAKHISGNEKVNTASVSTASTNVSIDINQIDEDDMEEMDIKWNMDLLSMRADRFWKKIGKKISIQGTDVAGFDKSKVECFNCHKMGHFARECKAPKSQDRGRRDNYRQGSKVEEQALKALMVFDNSLCSKACTDSLNSKITDLDDKLCDAKNMIYPYKLGLAQVEAILADHRNQEVKYCEKIRILEFKAESRANCIESLTKELELVKKEKEGLDSKLACFQTASKDLDSLLESQRLDKNKEGLGYSVVPPPPAQVYSFSKKDLSWTGLLEFVDDTVTNYSRPSPAIESTSDDAQNGISSVTDTEASPSTISSKHFIKFVKAADKPTENKIDKGETVKKPAAKYAELYRKPSKSSRIMGNQRNWNNLKSQQLGKKIVMKNKACFNCGQFDHLSYNYGLGVKMGRLSPKNNYTHRSMPPKPAIHKPYRPPLRPIRPNVNVTQPKRTSFYKPTHSYNKRPFQRKSAVRSQFRGPRVAVVNRKFPTVNRKLPTVNRKFPTGNTKFSIADLGNKEKAGSSQNNIDDKGYWDSGCSRHMTGNISYLSNYEPFDGGYVSFGQGGCKITGKGTIKTGKLEFENVYFVKDLKYNLFSVSQIYDNKNSMLFTDSECIVLGRNFKLLDDANVLLRTPR